MIRDVKKADPEADISGLEAEIDQLVYSLYRLTRGEIAVIEESLQEKTTSGKATDESALEQET